MFPRVFALVGLVFACGLALPGPASVAQEKEVNLIQNGSFEDGLKGWGRPTVQLVEDEKEAKSGKKCVAGEATEKNRAATIAQEIEMEAGRVYRVSFWIKSPQRTRCLVHLHYGDARRIEIIELRSTQRRWQRYQVLFSPRESGKQSLRFAIPSYFGQYGKPGKAFLDDVELVAIPQAEAAQDITRNDGFNDWPAMAADRAGNLWGAWISYLNPGEDRADPTKACVAAAGDRLRACLIRDGKVQKTFDVPVQCDGNILWPEVAGAADGAWLVWAMEVDHNWDIYAAKLSADGPGQITRVTTDPSVEVKAVAAVDKTGRLWVAWEGNRGGGRDIFCATLTDGKTSEIVKLTDNPTSDQNPTICVTDSGEVFVAYDSFRDSNYDIYMRRNVDGKWQPEARLTDDPVIDRGPHLSTLRGEPWLCWDNSFFGGYHMSSRTQERVRLGKIADEKVISPKGILQDAMLHTYVERASLAMDGTGRLWVAMKKARGQRGDFDTWVQCYSGDKWSEPILASGSMDGVARRAPMAALDGKLHLMWQSDDRPNRPDRGGFTGPQHSNVYYGTFDADKYGLPHAPLELEPYAPEEQPHTVKDYRTRFDEDRDRFAIDYKGEKLNLYWGGFHEHTELSQCNAKGDGAPDTNFAEVRDIARLDFAALTDHGQDMIPYDWQHLRKIVSINQDPGRFITYLAEEWAGSPKNLRMPDQRGTYGHRNVMFADEHFPRFYDPVDNTPPDKLWEILKGVDQITIPHQLADGGSKTDWYYVEEKNQPVAEIFQNRGSYEYFGAPRQASIFTEGYSLQDQWAKGTIIGVIASPDHGGGNGKAAVFAPELTRAAILDACRRRRTYGTTAAKILMDVRANGSLMGEVITVPADQTVSISVKVLAAGKIKQVEVAKDNKFVHTITPDGNTAEFVFEDTQPRQKRSHYYVRVLQDDEEIAWSSPVWVEQ
ncbi:MAG: carbohydrate binding domain-containing protein [Planctomycetota bacterium]